VPLVAPESQVMLQYNLADPLPFFALAMTLFAIVALRYFSVVGFFYLLLNVFPINALIHRRVQPLPPGYRQRWREVRWSVISSLIFSLVATSIAALWQQGYTAIYNDFGQYPWWWLPVSLVAAVLVHDTCYYWLHRWMHRPGIYRVIHRVHHESRVTSVWTSFSFHPVESLLQASIVLLIVLFLPLHYLTILAWLAFMTLTSTVNHCNVEVYPQNFYRHWIGKWLIGATHHSLHHKQFRSNFGLYFTFWDKWLGTESSLYEDKVREVTGLKDRSERLT